MDDRAKQAHSVAEAIYRRLKATERHKARLEELLAAGQLKAGTKLAWEIYGEIQAAIADAEDWLRAYALVRTDWTVAMAEFVGHLRRVQAPFVPLAEAGEESN